MPKEQTELEALNIRYFKTAAEALTNPDVGENDIIFTDDDDLKDYAKKSEVPTKTSDLTNDSGFVTSAYHDPTKQNKLTPGANITIDEQTNTISASGGLAEVNWGGITGTLSNQVDLKNALDGKQPTGDYATNTRVNEVEDKIPSLTGYATETYVNNHHDSTKQDVISDLTTIRTNASAGKSAKDTIDTYGDIVTHNADEFQSAGDYALKSEIPTNNNQLTNGAGYITSAYHDSTKQDVIVDLENIRSGAEAGSTALQSISSDDVTTALGFTPYNSTNPAGYITSSALTDYATQVYVQGYHDSTKQDVISDLSTIRSNAELGATALQSITSGDVTTALGYTPYNATNPNGYITSAYHDSTKQDTISDLATIRTNAQSGKTASDTISTYGNIVTHNASEFQTAGDYATNTRVNEVETIADNAKAIAEGKATGYVFDTKIAMDSWIPQHLTELKLGDNLYIRATDVPDYWWDGTSAQELETQKVDLSGYATQTYVQGYHDSTKQNVISDLDTIRTGAGLGATALQSITSALVTTALGYTPYNATNPNGYITSSALIGYATESYVTSQGYITSAYHDNTKQDIINDLANIRSGAELGATALQSFIETDPIYSADKPNIALKSEIPDISKLALDSGVVHKANAENISGVKTFTGGTGGNNVALKAPNGIAIGGTTQTAYAQYATIRLVNNLVNTGSYYIDGNGSVLFRHKTGTATAEGSANDVMFTMNPVTGIKAGWSGTAGKGITDADLHDVLIDTVEYSKLNTTAKDVLGAINEIKGLIPSLSGYATESYVQGYHDSTKQDVLVSGTSIKTINGESVLGSGDITVSGGLTVSYDLTNERMIIGS